MSRDRREIINNMLQDMTETEGRKFIVRELERYADLLKDRICTIKQEQICYSESTILKAELKAIKNLMSLPQSLMNGLPKNQKIDDILSVKLESIYTGNTESLSP